MKFIQANPDFYVINVVRDEMTNKVVGTIKEPVVAWAMDERGFPEPVTMEGIEKEAAILNPNGTVTCPGDCQFESEVQYFEAMKNE